MKRVLFVCVENSCRSQMAEGFAKKLGADMIESYSAGSRPSGVVNPKAIEAMRDAGSDISSNESKGFDSLPDCEWDAVVTMGCGDACPFIPARRRIDWDLPDPARMPQDEFNNVRNDIRRRVEELIAIMKE
jgi:protein-tyrosine-phosphatase